MKKSLALVRSTFGVSALDENIEKLRLAGLLVDVLENGLYNLVSTATGAVMARCIGEKALAEYVKCMEYVAKKHGNDIRKSYSYTKPVHTVLGLRGIKSKGVEVNERQGLKRAFGASG